MCANSAPGSGILPRLGLVERQPARSVVIWVADATRLPAAAVFARDLQQRYPRTHVCFVQDPGLEPVQGYATFATPMTAGVALLLRRLRARIVVVVGNGVQHAALARAARHRATPIVRLGSGVDEHANADLALAPDALAGGGAQPASDAAATFDALMVRSRRAALAEAGREPFSVRLLRQLRAPVLRPLLSLKFHEFESVDALRDALGRPRTILCLGNGPSSEHPSLAGLRHDRLFRVNMSWKARGLLTEPDLVFTGMADAVDALEPKVGFVFGKIQSEEKILAGLLRSWRRLRYATAERLGLMGEHPDEVGPTNGALMLALAVACQPDELVVAGIDLFRHPEGAYPGDTSTQNAYALGHDANYELDYIAAALSRFDGKLVVLSDVLREALGLPPP